MWIIFSITSLAAVISVLYSLSLPNIYHSQAILVSQDSANSNSTNAGGIGSLVSLAGVSITESTDSNSVKAMKKIQSFSFYEQNILPNIFLPELMAIKKWNASSNTLVFDQSLYDSKNNKWVRNYSYPKQLVPSAQESFKVFKNHFSISKDSDSGFITIRIKHQSPFVAKKWTELLINEINAYYRSKDRENAEKSINFLNEQLVKTKLTEVTQVFTTL